MKKFYLFVFLSSFIGALSAQIPGGNFEHWKTATFESPAAANWTVHDEELNPQKTGLLEKTTDASDGDYAIKFNTYGTRDFGYVVYGQVGENGPEGGIPFADNPTQLTVSYKCSLAEGDTAQVWVWLFSEGEEVIFDVFKFYGVQADYTDATFDLTSYTASPDSMMFAMVPDDPFIEGKMHTAGNYVCFDNVRFSGGDNNLQLPDNSFEDWTTKVLEYTEEMFEIEALVEKSDDAYNGMYALKMSTQNARWYVDEEEEYEEVNCDCQLWLWGYRTGVQVGEDNWEERYLGGLPVTERKDTLILHYKYMHPEQVVDTASVCIQFEKDSIRVYEAYGDLLQTDTWTEHQVPFDLDNAWGGSVEADSMILQLESTSWRETWTEADTNVEGSTLYVDYMYFASQAAYLGIEDENHPENIIKIFPNPSYDVLYIRGLTTMKDLEIISVNGALLYRANITGDTSIDISEYPAGVYLIRMDRKLLGKIIKQ